MENKFELSNEEISILQICLDMTNEKIDVDVIENIIKDIKLSSIPQPENGLQELFTNDLNVILEKKNYEELLNLLEKVKETLKKLSLVNFRFNETEYINNFVLTTNINPV